MEIRKVFVLKEAAFDLDEGRSFYDRKEEGVGDYFFDSLISDIESLRFFAGIHNKQFGFHRALSKRFPFAVYYEIDGHTVKITAVLDMRRNPAGILKKLEKRS